MGLNLHQSSAKPQSGITGLKLNADLGRFVRDKNPNNYIYPSNIFFFIWLMSTCRFMNYSFCHDYGSLNSVEIQ